MEKIRKHIKANPRLRIELLGMISKKLREFHVEISNDDLLKLTLCREDELGVGGESVDPPTQQPPVLDPTTKK